MRGKTQSGKKSVKPGKQVAVVAAHRRGAGRKARPAARKSLSRALATSNGQSLATLNPQELIVKAISKGDISTVEKLLQMSRELEADHAKKDYRIALARFQRMCPVIPKTKKVYNKEEKGGGERYRYAPLDVIIGLVHQVLADCGFSYMIKGEQKDNDFTAIVEGYHVGGHSETSRLTVPIMKDAYMTAPQMVASAQTFAKRQAFQNLFGIVTTDTDDDAQSAGLPTPNGAKGKGKTETPERNVSPGTLPENPGIKNVEELLKQMPWLPEKTAERYRQQAQAFVTRKDSNSLRGLAQSLSKQIALKKGAAK